jgi:hypothetical protein
LPEVDEMGDEHCIGVSCRKGIAMSRPLGVSVGRPVDLRIALSPTPRQPALAPARSQAPAPAPQGPEFAQALERLAGIDPAKRQEAYEAVRRELLQKAEGAPSSPALQSYRQAAQPDVPSALLSAHSA